MLNLFTVNTTIELICFVFAVICLAKDREWIWRIQILYLFITCVTEFSGILISKHKYNNQWVYNIFIIFEASFTHLMYGQLLKKYIQSKPIIIIGLVLFVGVYTYVIVKNGFFAYAYPAYNLMSVLFVIYSLYYYYLLLKDDEYVNLRYWPPFWWIVGSLFFYFGNTACDLFDDKLSKVMINIFHQHLTYFIYKILNIILYGCWSYSFICRRWLTTTSRG
jgi:hypothetical protein